MLVYVSEGESESEWISMCALPTWLIDGISM